MGVRRFKILKRHMVRSGAVDRRESISGSLWGRNWSTQSSSVCKGAFQLKVPPRSWTPIANAILGHWISFANGSKRTIIICQLVSFLCYGLRISAQYKQRRAYLFSSSTEYVIFTVRQWLIHSFTIQQLVLHLNCLVISTSITYLIARFCDRRP